MNKIITGDALTVLDDKCVLKLCEVMHKSRRTLKKNPDYMSVAMKRLMPETSKDNSYTKENKPIIQEKGYRDMIKKKDTIRFSKGKVSKGISIHTGNTVNTNTYKDYKGTKYKRKEVSGNDTISFTHPHGSVSNEDTLLLHTQSTHLSTTHTTHIGHLATHA